MLRSGEARRRAGAGLADALCRLERWLLPPACLLCQSPIPAREADALVCGLCRIRWRPVAGRLCDRCGQPLFGELDCRMCAEWPAGLTRVRSAVWLEGSARQAIHHLKYGGWWRIAEPMAEAMQGLGPLTGRVCLIPVPLGERRRRERGYNQSERIAAALSALVGAPVRAGLLVRARETRTQTALPPEARAANVRGAFRAGSAKGLDCVLVDDVFTTGATLTAAAAALSAAGAAAVEGVTFARALEPVTAL